MQSLLYQNTNVVKLHVHFDHYLRQICTIKSIRSNKVGANMSSNKLTKYLKSFIKSKLQFNNIYVMVN